MASKTFLLLGLAFAVVLLISSQVTAAKGLDDSKVEDAKYGRGGYNRGDLPPTYGPPTGPSGSCGYGCCGGGGMYNGGCRCCGTSAEATAYKQAHEAQTHN